MEKYESMQYIWMSYCDITLGGCKILAAAMSRLNVEVIQSCVDMEEESSDDDEIVKALVGRTKERRS